MENWKEAIEDPGFITVFSAMLNYILVLELARRTDPDTMDGEITYEGISDRAKDLSLFLNDQEIVDPSEVFRIMGILDLIFDKEDYDDAKELCEYLPYMDEIPERLMGKLEGMIETYLKIRDIINGDFGGDMIKTSSSSN